MCGSKDTVRTKLSHQNERFVYSNIYLLSRLNWFSLLLLFTVIVVRCMIRDQSTRADFKAMVKVCRIQSEQIYFRPNIQILLFLQYQWHFFKFHLKFHDNGSYTNEGRDHTNLFGLYNYGSFAFDVCLLLLQTHQLFRAIARTRSEKINLLIPGRRDCNSWKGRYSSKATQILHFQLDR